MLDLFAGMGGFSLGFKKEGFQVTGVDDEELAEATFRENELGDFVQADLRMDQVVRDAEVVVGGPPCKPWSSVNVQRRGIEHRDYELLDRFFDHVHEMSPFAFLMENVPAVLSDPGYQSRIRDLAFSGYSVATEIIRYSDFGAATGRRRMFTVGFRDSIRWNAEEFFRWVDEYRSYASTVRQEIEWLSGAPRGEPQDHVWSQLESIGNYRDRYESGQFGWKRLEWDEPAPSFGSVSKTYILHPSSRPSGPAPRVVSVREVMSIMGFPREFRFPEGAPLADRYQMVANAVSPVFSHVCAKVLREMLYGAADG